MNEHNTVYYALVEAIISYGLSSYGCTFKSYLDKIKQITFSIVFFKSLVLFQPSGTQSESSEQRKSPPRGTRP